ncbi:DUF2799 domain-containing protein [Vibrio porteresiae]|uniref:DUF2799 domain-containing protein n=1 Tax=Vibrio porteresiae DSM 19223 TaxID=1123496 RepID=A0ABZ0QDI2_9VIBR|nr:DUF2799 domain-containing protein [Vibrio porteresiae]WPC73593.1 DUF2799 domain-containing protein [Vibrio porteresiae DSM 19223]
MKNVFCLIALVLAGCAANDAGVTTQTDAYSMGYQDGIRGREERSYQQLTSLGAGGQSDYDRGYSQGVAVYCNPNAAYQIGLSGQMYEGVCDHMKNGQKFRMEWQRGWRDYNQ